MRVQRCRECMEERWRLAANKSNLRFCNSNCLGYADAKSSRVLLRVHRRHRLFSLPLSLPFSLPFAIHPSRKSWGPLTRRNTPTCANSFAESVPTLMHVRRTSGSAFTRIAVTGCGGNMLVTKGEQSRGSTRCVGKVICSIQQKWLL